MSLVIACRVGVVVGADRCGTVGRPQCSKQSTVGGGRWWGISATSGAVVVCANGRFVRTVSCVVHHRSVPFSVLRYVFVCCLVRRGHLFVVLDCALERGPNRLSGLKD
jgi:hypothetical protein